MVIKQNDRVIYSKINPFHKSFDLHVGRIYSIKDQCAYIKTKTEFLIIPLNNVFLKVSFWLAFKFIIYQYCDYIYRWIGNFLRKQLIIGAPMELNLEALDNETEFLHNISNTTLKEVEKAKIQLQKATDEYNEAMHRYVTAHNAYITSWYKSIEKEQKPYIKDLL